MNVLRERRTPEQVSTGSLQLLRRLQRRLRRFCAFILLSILACVRLMLPDRSEITL